MKVIYLATPYTAPTPYEVSVNVTLAHFAHDELVRLGVAVIAPAITSAHKDGLFMSEDMATDTKYWIDSGLEKLRRCDAMVVQGGAWESSKGVNAEIREAHRRRIPVFFEIEHFKMWLEQQRI